MLAGSRQLVVGVGDGWDSTRIELVWYERGGAGEAWRERARWPGVVGVSGMAWGRGLHGVGAPAGAAVGDPIKREGDGRAPAGVFVIEAGFGEATAPPAGTKWPYRQATAGLRCVDDPTSAHYNRLVEASAVKNDWSSAEDMLRSDGLHRLGLWVGHNGAPVEPGAGSCIFFHVWHAESGTAGATVGCTALAESHLAELLSGLDPAARPTYVLLPRAAHDKLAAAWGLPAR